LDCGKQNRKETMMDSAYYTQTCALVGLFLAAITSLYYNSSFDEKTILPTHREVCFILIGSILSILFSKTIYGSRKASLHHSPAADDTKEVDDDECTIQTIEDLRAVLPVGLSGSGFDDAQKVIPYLDDQMTNFIHQSPFLQLATVDGNGIPFVSPKGDPAGFVTVIKDSEGKKGTSLIIPDRPGNRLLFGLQNILENPHVSILFEIPGNCTTLRCGGVVTKISKNPTLLQSHVARKCKPTVVIVVKINHAFFHCAKAYMRSQLWEPTSWPLEKYEVRFGQYFCKQKDSILANRIDKGVADHYEKVQRSVDGQCAEVD